MTEELHSLAGAYVLDALEEDERRAFVAYMAANPEVAAEVAALREAGAALGASAAEAPPPGMRRAVLDRVDVMRQERPVVADRPPEPTASPEPAGTGVGAGGRWATRLALGAAAVAVAVSVGLGAALVSLQDRVDTIADRSRRLALLVAAEDAEQARAPLPDGGVLAAIVSEDAGVGVAVANNLLALDDGQMYALWGIAAGVPIPLGELVDGEPLTLDAAAFEAIGVTVEPRGELTTPTSPVIATLPA